MAPATFSRRRATRAGARRVASSDYLLYYFVGPRRLYILPMIETRDWFLAHQDRFPERETSTVVGEGGQYITVGRLVPVGEVVAHASGVKTRQL